MNEAGDVHERVSLGVVECDTNMLGERFGPGLDSFLRGGDPLLDVVEDLVSKVKGEAGVNAVLRCVR